MWLRLVLSSLLVVAGSVPAGAQEVTNEDVLNQIKMLQADLAERVKANEASIVALQNQLDDLRTTLNDQTEQQRQILDSISQVDSAGQRIPQLSAIMDQSEDFRQDVYRAVHNSLQTSGTVTVTNKMSTSQVITVNRVSYTLLPGETRAMEVPVGTVTTRLPGQSERNWTLSAPDYEEAIDIVPSSSPTITTLRPTVYTEPQSVYYSSSYPYSYSYSNPYSYSYSYPYSYSYYWP